MNQKELIEKLKTRCLEGIEKQKKNPNQAKKEQPKAKTEVKKDTKEKKNPFIVKRK